MRFIFAGAVLAMTFYSNISASQAFENAPWCAVTNKGMGNAYWDCQYFSIEQCVPHVIAGDRGTCNLNPSWSAQTPATTGKNRKRYRG